MISVPEQTAMAMKSYQDHAEVLVRDYLIADPFIPYTSMICGLLACKVVLPIFDLDSSH